MNYTIYKASESVENNCENQKFNTKVVIELVEIWTDDEKPLNFIIHNN